MSYCRWSSLNGYCDVYLYESVGDYWALHLAGRRKPKGAPPNPIDVVFFHDFIPSVWRFKAYEWRKEIHDKWRESKEYQDLDLKYAGESFAFDSPGEVAVFLEELKEIGYIFPEDLIETLREEQEELDENQ